MPSDEIKPLFDSRSDRVADGFVTSFGAVRGDAATARTEPARPPRRWLSDRLAADLARGPVPDRPVPRLEARPPVIIRHAGQCNETVGESHHE